ncbi:hypothetical protein D3C75_796390 [compost metagenome]
MYHWLRRLIGCAPRPSCDVCDPLTMEEIDSKIRGLRMLHDLRYQHRNWSGANACLKEIIRLRTQRAALEEDEHVIAPIVW